MRNLSRPLQLAVFSCVAVLLAAATVVQARTPAPQRGRAHSGAVVACASNDQRTQRCRVTWRDARLVHQDSRAACVRGRSWGIARGFIWVSNGCRGQFAQAGGRGRGRARHWNRDIRVSCASHGYAYQMCRVDVGRRGDVILVHQESSTRCVRGKTWGYNRAGVWVDRGCSARFLVHRR